MENPLDYGSRVARPGTENWAKSWRLDFWGLLNSAKVDVQCIHTSFRLGEKFGAWKLLRDADGNPFPTLWAVVEAPAPHGCGVPAAKVKALLAIEKGRAVAAALSTRAEAAPKAGGKREGAGRPVPPSRAEPTGNQAVTPKNQRTRPNVESVRGETSDYLAARIARDAPGVHEDMKAGKYKSVRAAAKAAGIVKDPDPVRVAARALSKVPIHRCAELVRAIDPPFLRMIVTCARDAGVTS